MSFQRAGMLWFVRALLFARMANLAARQTMTTMLLGASCSGPLIKCCKPSYAQRSRQLKAWSLAMQLSEEGRRRERNAPTVAGASMQTPKQQAAALLWSQAVAHLSLLPSAQSKSHHTLPLLHLPAQQLKLRTRHAATEPKLVLHSFQFSTLCPLHVRVFSFTGTV